MCYGTAKRVKDTGRCARCEPYFGSNRDEILLCATLDYMRVPLCWLQAAFGGRTPPGLCNDLSLSETANVYTGLLRNYISLGGVTVTRHRLWVVMDFGRPAAAASQGPVLPPINVSRRPHSHALRSHQTSSASLVCGPVRDCNWDR